MSAADPALAGLLATCPDLWRYPPLWIARCAGQAPRPADAATAVIAAFAAPRALTDIWDRLVDDCQFRAAGALLERLEDREARQAHLDRAMETQDAQRNQRVELIRRQLLRLRAAAPIAGFASCLERLEQADADLAEVKRYERADAADAREHLDVLDSDVAALEREFLDQLGEQYRDALHGGRIALDAAARFERAREARDVEVASWQLAQLTSDAAVEAPRAPPPLAVVSPWPYDHVDPIEVCRWLNGKGSLPPSFATRWSAPAHDDTAREFGLRLWAQCDPQKALDVDEVAAFAAAFDRFLWGPSAAVASADAPHPHTVRRGKVFLTHLRAIRSPWLPAMVAHHDAGETGASSHRGWPLAIPDPDADTPSSGILDPWTLVFDPRRLLGGQSPSLALTPAAVFRLFCAPADRRRLLVRDLGRQIATARWFPETLPAWRRDAAPSDWERSAVDVLYPGDGPVRPYDQAAAFAASFLDVVGITAAVGHLDRIDYLCGGNALALGELMRGICRELGNHPGIPRRLDSDVIERAWSSEALRRRLGVRLRRALPDLQHRILVCLAGNAGAHRDAPMAMERVAELLHLEPEAVAEAADQLGRTGLVRANGDGLVVVNGALGRQIVAVFGTADR